MTNPHPQEREHGLVEHPDPVSVRAYFIVFAVLMVLLVLTIMAAFMHLGRFALAAAMAIAATKALLVVLYFMHLRYSSVLTRVFLFATFVWLGILAVLTFNDYLTRGWLPVSRGWME